MTRKYSGKLDLRKLLMSIVLTVLITGLLLQTITIVFSVSYGGLAIMVIFMLIELIVYCMLLISYGRWNGEKISKNKLK